MNDTELTPSSSSGSAEFLRQLFTTGHLSVPPLASGTLEIDEDAFVVLQQWDLVVRQDLAADVPPMDRDAAAWAAKQFFKACQCLVDRDVSEEAMRTTLSETFPTVRDPRVDYSVDLIFRFLPDLFSISRHIAPQDVLNDVFKKWAHEWPLSSVGIDLSTADSPANFPARPTLDSFFQHPALRRLYLDRITAALAKDRLVAPEVRRWLQAELDAYPSLAPLVRDALVQQALPPASAS